MAADLADGAQPYADGRELAAQAVQIDGNGVVFCGGILKDGLHFRFAYHTLLVAVEQLEKRKLLALGMIVAALVLLNLKGGG